MKRKILVLPDAGVGNPFQYQLIKFLRESGLTVVTAPTRRFFAATRAFHRHHPHSLYFDWIQSFILGKTWVVTLLKCFCFWIEILYLVKIKRVPIFHTLHNIRNHAGRWRRTEYVIYRFFLKNCFKIRVYSDSTRMKASRYFDLDIGKIDVIQDVPFHHFYPNQVSKTASRSFLKVGMEDFLFLFLGMLKPYKGIEQLIEAFDTLHDSNARLVVAGCGESPEYEKLIGRKLEQVPNTLFINKFVPVEEVQYFMNAADAVVLPFKNIEHSGSIDLAMSFKKAVITKKTPFTENLLSHQKQLLFDKRHGSLHAALRSAKSANVNAIGEANFKLADDSNYKRLLSFFDVVVAQH